MSAKLVRSLVHPQRSSAISVLRFSDDGARLFAAGYPSGVLQLWDAATWKELRRVETPPGYRGSADYVELTAGWKSVVVPVEHHKVIRGEKNGEPNVRVEEDGEVRAWDLATGEPRPAVKLPGRYPLYAIVSPDGTKLVTVERPSFDSADRDRPPDVAVFRDLTAGTVKELVTGFGMAAFSPDGKRFAVASGRHGKAPARLALYDAATGDRTVTLAEEPGASIYWPTFSPDGRRVTAEVRSAEGAKGAVVRVWDVAGGKVVAEFAPLAPAAVFEPTFSADGRLVSAMDRDGNVYVWDVAGRKSVFVHRATGAATASSYAISRDGRRAAVAAVPRYDPKSLGPNPDPADRPQPRIELYDLATGKRLGKMVAPHGHAGPMAFSPDGKRLAFAGTGAVHLFDVSGPIEDR